MDGVREEHHPQQVEALFVPVGDVAARRRPSHERPAAPVARTGRRMMAYHPPGCYADRMDGMREAD